MWFTRVSVKYPVFTIMMMFCLMVLGLASWQRMNVEEFPDIDFPFVVLHTTYAGASPEVIESEVTKPLEDQINTLSGLKQVISISSQGLSSIIAEFNLDVNSAVAAQDVRDKTASVISQFRDEIDDPVIERYDPRASPIMSIVFESTNMDMRTLSDYVDQQLMPQLRTVSGVGRVNLMGDAKRQIRIEVKPALLQSYQIAINDVIQALKNDNVNIPAGTLTNQHRELVVEIQGKFVKPYDFNHLIVANRNGQAITLGQIADIKDSQEEQTSSALLNGSTVLSLDILKNSDANIITVINALNKRLENIQTQLPPGMTLTVVSDRSIGIRASIQDVVRTIIEGGVLAVLIVLLFLGSVRSTIITGVTLPITLLGTLAVIWAAGFSINMMTLLALSLSIGLLIDDAIVVRENIVRHADMGKDHVTAALDGTKEIGLAVLATSLTIVAVFLPVAFMGGIIGRFFYQFGVTVSAAVIISMFVSLTLDPMLSAHWAEKNNKTAKTHLFTRFFNWTSTQLDKLNLIYEKVLRWALRFRFLTLMIAVISLFAALALSKLIGSEFVPTPDKGEILIKFETPIDSSIHYTSAKVKQVEAILQQNPHVQQTYSVVNPITDRGLNHANIMVKLKSKHERQQSLIHLSNEFRQQLNHIAGVRIISIASGDESVTGGQKPILISIKGPDLKELQHISDRFMLEMQKIDGLVDLESSLGEPRPTLAIDINRPLANDLGLSLNNIASTLRPLLAGENVSTWQDARGENYDVNLRLNESERTKPSDLDQLFISTGQSSMGNSSTLIPLSSIVTLTEVQGASQINRRDLTREILIEANTSGRPSGDIGKDIENLQKKFDLPHGYQFSTQGANADMAESAGYALTAITLSIIFIYIILGSQFNSFIHPAAIMASLPLSLIGVFLALFLFNSTLNLFSIIGIIMLLGLVTKNAILLIDFIKKAMEQGEDRFNAIIQAGKTRLRPILMTTSAMVMGMVPLALGLGESGEQSAPMAHAVIGGVITSTLLTLIVVPVVFTYLDDWKNFCMRYFKKAIN